MGACRGLVGACFLAGLRFSPTILLLALIWAVAQVLLGMAFGSLGTSVADRIPESRLGAVSSVGGLGTFLGAILGAVGVAIVFASLGLNTYFLIALLVAFGPVGFVLWARDRSSTALAISPFNWRDFFRGFLVPLLDNDFRLVWIARIILYFGYTTSTALAFYMMQSYIHPAMSAEQATRTGPLLSLVGVPITVVTLVLAGRLSDKVGRRKSFVIVASLLMAISMAVPLLSPTLLALFIQVGINGIALGIYLPVDQALFIDVLPDKHAAGRDLGIAGLGTNLGQALGPILAAQVVALTASYRLVWAVALILVLAAAIIIVPVKRVR